MLPGNWMYPSAEMLPLLSNSSGCRPEGPRLFVGAAVRSPLVNIGPHPNMVREGAHTRDEIIGAHDVLEAELPVGERRREVMIVEDIVEPRCIIGVGDALISY